jgi:hypothetical protein
MRRQYDLGQLDWTLAGWTPYLWRLQRSIESGASSNAEVTSIPAPVPGSVQGALRAAGILPDWNVGLNVRLCECQLGGAHSGIPGRPAGDPGYRREPSLETNRLVDRVAGVRRGARTQSGEHGGIRRLEAGSPATSAGHRGSGLQEEIPTLRRHPHLDGSRQLPLHRQHGHRRLPREPQAGSYRDRRNLSWRPVILRVASLRL